MIPTSYLIIICCWFSKRSVLPLSIKNEHCDYTLTVTYDWCLFTNKRRNLGEQYVKLDRIMLSVHYKYITQNNLHSHMYLITSSCCVGDVSCCVLWEFGRFPFKDCIWVLCKLQRIIKLRRRQNNNHSRNLHSCFQYLTYLIPSCQAMCQPSIELLLSQFLKLC